MDSNTTDDLSIVVGTLAEEQVMDNSVKVDSSDINMSNVPEEPSAVENSNEPSLGSSTSSCLDVDSDKTCLDYSSGEPCIGENLNEISVVKSSPSNEISNEGAPADDQECFDSVDIEDMKKETISTEPALAAVANVVTECPTIPQASVVQVGTAGMADGYIILSKEAAASLGMETTASSESSENPAKRFRLEGEDGQSYVLTVTDSGSTEIHTENKLQNAATVLEAVSASAQALPVSSHIKKNSDASQDVSQSWFTTRDDKMALQSKGASWKQGQWTKDEVEILQSNINTYCKDHCINDPTEIIFEMSKDERKDFYRTVAKGLQRPLFSVYRRVTRMYDQKNHMGKYTPEEMAKLRELRMKFGNDWASIGASLGRSASSVKDKCRLMRDTCNSGKWLPEEERRLAEAVYEFAGIKPGQNVTSGLSWANVAERVITRSEKQCRTKWLNYLNWKQKGGTDWTREDDINLVLKISSFGVSDDTEIDWNDLAKNWPSVRSPQWLRGKWWSLKRHVPDYQILPFNDLIEYLKTVHLRSVHLKYPLGSNIKLAKDNLARPDMTFHIPVPMTATRLDSSLDSEGFQAYEVLQQTTSGAYLITQPQNNPAISFSGPSMNTDHIIVHTLPTNTLRGSNNVTVQMNPSPVIISASTGEAVPSTEINTIRIQDVVTHTEQDFQGLHQDDQITADDNAMSETGLNSHSELHTDTSIISEAEEAFNSQAITGSDIVADSVIGESDMVRNPNSDSSDLVMVSSASPHLVTENRLISSLSDPMLPSGGTDLIGSSSDVETEKGTPHDSEHDTDITSADISEHQITSN